MGECRYSVGIEVSGQRHAPAAFIHGTHWMGGWIAPRNGLGVKAKRKIPAPAGNATPASTLVAIH